MEIKIIQYNVALAINGALTETSKEKLCQELDFESLQSRRRFRELSLFHKIIKNEATSHLYCLIPKRSTSCLSHNSEKVPSIKANCQFFKKLFSIHHYRMKQIRFQYSPFSFLKTLSDLFLTVLLMFLTL